MQLHIKAAALMAATFVGGCGFVPKNPPKPTEGQRIPINMTAPNPRPWAGPMLAQPIQPASLPLASTPAAQTSVPSEHIVASRDTTPSLSAKGVASEPKPPQTDNEHVSKGSAPEEPIAMWPVLLTFNPDEQLDNSAPRLPSERISFSWPEQPVKNVLPEAVLAAQSSPSLPEPSEASPQPVHLLEAEMASALHVANAQPVEPKVTDHHQAVAADITDGQAPQDASRSATDSSSSSVTQESQPDTQALNTTHDLAKPAPQIEPASTSAPVTTAEPEPEPSPPLQTWSAQAGMTLSELLSTWGADQNWIVRWASEADFRIEAPFSIQAPDFLAAATHIFKAYQNAGRTFTVRAYANQVLVVTLPTD